MNFGWYSIPFSPQIKKNAGPVYKSVPFFSATEFDDFDSQWGVQNGRLCVVKRKHNSQLNIDMRTSTFMIFMSIVRLVEHSIDQVQEMLKCMRDIFLAAFRSFNWYQCPGVRSTMSFECNRLF